MRGGRLALYYVGELYSEGFKPPLTLFRHCSMGDMYRNHL